MDGRRTVRFRSLLELIFLLKDALESADDPQADETLRQWKNGPDDGRSHVGHSRHG